MTGKPIHELTRGECRFPTTPDSAPKHFFCAEPVEREGVVYCAKHAKLCYDRRPPEKRRKDAQHAAVARAGRANPCGYLTGPRTTMTKDMLIGHGGMSRDELP